MTKPLTKTIKKVLIALRWKPRRVPSFDTDVVSNDNASTNSRSKGGNGRDDGDIARNLHVHDDTAAEDGQPEPARVQHQVEVEQAVVQVRGSRSEVTNGHDHAEKAIGPRGGREDEDGGDTAADLANDVESRSFDKLSERARRFSLPLALSRKSSSKNRKGKEKEIAVISCDVLEEEETPKPWGGISLADLPFDVLFTLMSLSDVASVLSLSQTCRTLHNVSESPTLWIDLSIGLQRRSRILALDDLTHPYSLHSDIPSLKRIVIRTDYLERNWQSSTPRTVASSRVLPGQPKPFRQRSPTIKLDYDMGAMLFAGPFFISEQFWLLSTVHGEIIGWDISAANEEDKEGRIIAHELGIFNMNVAFGLCTLRMHHAERNIYAITCVPEDSAVYSNYNVLKIRFPSPADQDLTPERRQLEFSIAGSYIISSTWRIKTQNIDYMRKRICILFQVVEEESLRLYVLLNWETSEHVEINTNLYHLRRESGLGLRFSDDGEFVHTYVMTGNLWVQKTYSIISLQDLYRRTHAPNRQTALTIAEGIESANWPLRQRMFTFDQTVPPVLVVSEELDMPSFVFDPHAELCQYWNLSQWWQRYAVPQHNIHIPTCFSRILFYYIHPHALGDDNDVEAATLTEEEEERQRKAAWKVVQFYSTSERPMSRRVFVCSLYDCPAVRLGDLGFPIMGASFNHLAWIEYETVKTMWTTVEGGGSLLRLPWKRDEKKGELPEKSRIRRVLRLLTFPEAGVSPDSEYEVSSLPERSPQMRDLDDVPESVLDKAVHIFLEPAMAAVLIATSDNEMHRFHYA